MKKTLINLLCATFLIFTLSFGLSLTVYAVEDNGVEQENQTTIDDVDYEHLQLEEAEETTARLVEWVIAGVVGLLGTSVVAVAFRRQLKNLITKILEGLSLLKQNKDIAEEDIKKIKDEADKTLASLKNVKNEMLEISKQEFEVLNRQVNLLSKVVVYMAGGMKELVVNGTSESIYNMLKEPSKEEKKDASEEIQ